MSNAFAKVDGVEVQQSKLLDLYPYSFASVLKILMEGNCRNYGEALKYLSTCRISCIIYPVRPVTVLDLRIINVFRQKFSLVEKLLNQDGISDTARMADTENEIEKIISDIQDTE